MRFDQLDEALEEQEPLILPIAGADSTVRDYAVQPATGDRWLRMAALREVQRALAVGITPADGDLQSVLQASQRSMLDDALGADVTQAMIDDGVSARMLRRAGAVALTYHIDGADQARQAWSGKAESPSTLSGKTGDEADATSTDSTSGTSTPTSSPSS